MCHLSCGEALARPAVGTRRGSWAEFRNAFEELVALFAVPFRELHQVEFVLKERVTDQVKLVLQPQVIISAG